MRLHRDRRPKRSVADAHQHTSCQEVVELVTDHLEAAMGRIEETNAPPLPNHGG